jgi:two-component system response regulator (stage 0 sporulation protein F)
MPKIFLVENDAELRTRLRDLLLKSGHEVLEFTNGKDVLEMYQRLRPDLVVTDLVMPEKEGLELLLELRRIVQNAKCIAMSENGPGGDAYLQVARKFGAKLTLSKPFTDAEFLEAVISTLESDPLVPGRHSGFRE